MPSGDANMTQPVVDRRFVANPGEDGMELRLAIHGEALHVVGTRGDKMAILDTLVPCGGQEPADVLAAVSNEKYGRLVSPDPMNVGTVQTSTSVGPFQVVGAEDL
jgi:hypothetical protein